MEKNEQKKIGNIGCLTVLVSVVLILIILFTIDQIKDVRYEKISEYVGNSQNRSIAYYAEVVDFEDMARHARMQGKKGATTMVFYFDDKENVPEELSESGNIIEEKYKSHCVAAYYRWDSGEEEFIQYPFR